jgi:hypothetical protein
MSLDSNQQEMHPSLMYARLKGQHVVTQHTTACVVCKSLT